MIGNDHVQFCSGRRRGNPLPDRNQLLLEGHLVDIHHSLVDVSHMHLLDRAVEQKRRLVEVFERDRRAEVGANVEAVAGGEEQRYADRHVAFGDFFPVGFDSHTISSGALADTTRATMEAVLCEDIER